MFILFLSSCSHQVDDAGNSKSIQPDSTSNEILYWVEIQGRFYTKDLAKAQKEIPFPILLPTYLPNNLQDTYLPDIDGPLGQFRDDNNIEVNIKYHLNSEHKLPRIIIIRERNYSSSLGDPEFNPELERIENEGISVIKTRDDWSPDSDSYYSFNSHNIYYIVETHNLPNEESNKIVESIIDQLE